MVRGRFAQKKKEWCLTYFIDSSSGQGNKFIRLGESKA